MELLVSPEELLAARGVLVHADNLEALGVLLPVYAGRIGLVYLDPPYNTGRTLDYADRLSRVEWGALIRPRLASLRPFLSPNGSMWAQIDDHEEMTLRLALDDCFGADSFVNAIRWVYGSTARGAKAHGRRLARNHDTLLVYGKDPKRYRMNPVRVGRPYRPEEARARGFQEDERGWFKTAPRGDYTDASIGRLRGEGRIYETASGGIRIRYPLRSEGGLVIEDCALGDVWTDLPDMMHSPRAERLGFPTQKPLALLQRVLTLGGQPADWVLDPFGGTGTTAIAALEQNRLEGGDRRFILVESGPHFETVLLPRVRAAMQGDPRSLVVLR